MHSGQAQLDNTFNATLKVRNETSDQLKIKDNLSYLRIEFKLNDDIKTLFVNFLNKNTKKQRCSNINIDQSAKKRLSLHSAIQLQVFHSLLKQLEIHFVDWLF